MLSKVTIYSFLLASMLGLGIKMWWDGRRDDCSRYLAGDRSYPSKEAVVDGGRTIAVPCGDWLSRMPVRAQLLCLVDVLLGAVFFFNALADLQGWLRWRRRLRSSV
jgi:hypothetical protein